MGDRQRASRAHILPRFLATASVFAAFACTHETGESKVMHLQTGLDKEFPDRDMPLDGTPWSASAVHVDGSRPPPVTPDPVAKVDTKSLIATPAAVAPSEAPTRGELRPVIRITGSSKPRGPGHGVDDRIEMTLPDEGVAAPQPSAEPGPAGDAKQEYDRALALLNAHDFDHALEGFSAFLVKWPDQPLAESALYWSGDCYLAKGEVVQAIVEFDSALSRFPTGRLAPDSLLKLGLSQERLGNPDKAKGYFERLRQEYPKSDAARRIPGDHATSLK
jgi:tol-pal system protein YbgF